MSLILYYHPLSSYCHKVLIALYENATDFEKRIINLGDEADRALLLRAWPIGKFPVVRDVSRKRDIAETSIIIEYLDHYFPGAQLLIPDEWEDALRVRSWDRFLDLYVHQPMQQIVGDRLRGAQGDTTRERATLDTAYSMIDEHMQSRTWMASQSFGMADCAATPALFYASAIKPIPPSHTRLHTYFERLMERPSVKQVLKDAKPYFQFFPFADAIPERFR